MKIIMIKKSLIIGTLLTGINYSFFNPSLIAEESRECNRETIRQTISESELENCLERIRGNVCERYVNAYLEEARETVGTIEDLVDDKGYDEVKKIFMEEQEVPLSVLRGEINLDEAVSEMSRLYGQVDDRMNWNSGYITPKIREDIEFKVSMYSEMIENNRYNVNQEEVNGLIDLSEGLLDGIKDEIKSDNAYVGLIPFGKWAMMTIADRMMNPSRRATRNAYRILLEEEGSESGNENE